MANFAHTWNKYFNKSIDISLACMGQRVALRERKVDPFIAGGAANGIAGLGAGIYVAGETTLRNKKIDDNREYWNNEVYKKTANLSALDKELLSSAEKLEKVLNSIPTIKKVREEYFENLYKICKKDIKNMTLLDTRKILKDGKTLKDNIEEVVKYLSIVGYKDSAELQHQFEIKVKKLDTFFSVALVILFIVSVLILVGIFSMY